MESESQNDNWKKILEEDLQLKCNNEELDYEFAVTFLNNNKSFEDKYYEACDKGYEQIQQLLRDNNKMPSITIQLDIKDFNTNKIKHIEIINLDFYKVLMMNKNLPFEKFVSVVISSINKNREIPILRSDLNKVVIESFITETGVTSGEMNLVGNMRLGKFLYSLAHIS